ncbi:ferredoxin-NADP(+) reductase [Secundilactobacillus oryzae JCM 18671]|uniref:Ferredoxin--NADP reductase n=1 Tax=Secundilactobacillus oryzae JCM 18671 TaxID=1291743 RepID=A0A081BJB4_9LACO|nr:NAD(P)/FAD-dependent oxidoreductase [Secundilactobacillus oryzae]GAK48132.1 ferredoxin-NADP(+) reductase [Secundilactobacillus oryzae JCM 18671]
MTVTDEIYDITIIGGGPVGMFAGFYAGLRTARTQLIESLSELGGQVQALYPEKVILDIAGFPAIKGSDLIAQQTEQFNDFPIDVFKNETVTDIVREADGFQVTTNRRTTRTKKILLAIGNGAFTPRKLAVEGIDHLEGQSLFYNAAHLDHFRNRDVLIAGGGDAAIDQALMLEPVAHQVTIVHRRDSFRALEYMVQKLEDSSVNIKTPFLVHDIQEQLDGKLDIALKRVKTDDDIEHVQVDDILVSYGFVSDNKAVSGWHVDFEEDHRMIKVNSFMQTSEPGIYAIGDGVLYPGKQQLIATGYGEGPTAINAMMQEIYPDRRGPVHSTSLKLK